MVAKNHESAIHAAIHQDLDRAWLETTLRTTATQYIGTLSSQPGDGGSETAPRGGRRLPDPHVLRAGRPLDNGLPTADKLSACWVVLEYLYRLPARNVC